MLTPIEPVVVPPPAPKSPVRRGPGRPRKHSRSGEDDDYTPKNLRKRKPYIRRVKYEKVECEICLKVIYKEQLVLHNKLHHSSSPKKSFEEERQANKEEGFVELVDGKPFSCQYCVKGYSSEQKLIAHENYHRKYKDTMANSTRCSVCKKRFCNRYYLQDHMNIHTGAKPYPCTVCGERFHMKQNLKLHLVKRCPGEQGLLLKEGEEVMLEATPKDVARSIEGLLGNKVIEDDGLEESVQEKEEESGEKLVGFEEDRGNEGEKKTAEDLARLEMVEGEKEGEGEETESVVHSEIDYNIDYDATTEVEDNDLAREGE